MSVGLGITRAAIDAKSAIVGAGLRDSLNAAHGWYTLLSNTTIFPNTSGTEQFLTGAGIAYSAPEAALLRAAAADGEALYKIANNIVGPTIPNDFMFNIRQLLGVTF